MLSDFNILFSSRFDDFVIRSKYWYTVMISQTRIKEDGDNFTVVQKLGLYTIQRGRSLQTSTGQDYFRQCMRVNCNRSNSFQEQY